MNFKKLLMLVAGTVLVVPTTLSVVACNNPIQLKEIASVVTIRNLQAIVVPSSDQSDKPSYVEILKAINKINKITLVSSDVKISVTSTTKATVTGIGNYDGSVLVTFTTQVEKNINSLIKEKKLGEIIVNSGSTQPSAQQVLDAINLVNKDLKLTNKGVTINVINATKATVTGMGIYDGSTNVTFTTQVEKNINSVITIKDLKDIIIPSKQSDGKPTAEQILIAINLVNKGISLKVTDINISSVTPTGAVVAGAGDYDGSINITYKTIIQTNINSVIKIKELGNIVTVDGKQPTAEQILLAINTVNKDAKLELANIDFNNITLTGADITGKGNYDANTKVTFKVSKEQTDIASVIKKQDLKEITTTGGANPTIEQVLSAINAVNNSKLSKTDVSIESITNSKAMVIGIGDFTGSIEVKFSVKDAQTDIATVIKTKELGDIITVKGIDVKPEQVIAAINLVNKDIKLTVNDIKITNIAKDKATVTGNGNYDGSVIVTFTTVKEYSDADIQDALNKAILETNPLKVSIKKTSDYKTAVKELTDVFKKDNDKLFIDLLSKDMQKQFNVKKLGFFNQVYKTANDEYYVKTDFFKNSQEGVKVYFYIAYNKDGHTDDDGLYIPIMLTITN